MDETTSRKLLLAAIANDLCGAVIDRNWERVMDIAHACKALAEMQPTPQPAEEQPAARGEN